MAVPITAAILGALGIGGIEALRRRGTDAYDVANYDPLAQVDMPAGEDLPLPPRPPSSPVVTASPTANAPQSGGDLPQSAQDLLARIRGQANPVESQSAESANTATQPPADQNSTPMDRLANFGFAMAASRNPSLFGQIGEAGLAMQRGDRERRQDNIRQQQVDVEQEYRRAQVDLARAEQAWQQDPNNPRSVALLAEARYRLAMAERAAREPSGGGTGGDGRVVARELGEDGVVYNVFRDGSVRQATLPDGTPFRRGDSVTNMDQRIAGARTAALNELRQNPLFMTLPEDRQREAIATRARDILQNNLAQNPIRQQRGTAGASPNAPVESPNRPVYDLSGRPLTR